MEKPTSKLKRTVRVSDRKQKREASAASRTINKGGKLMGQGQKLSGKAMTRSSREVSKSVRSGELRSGPKKSNRYRTDDAQMKIQTGRNMQTNPKAYSKGKKSVNRSVRRTAQGPLSQTLNRYGRPLR